MSLTPRQDKTPGAAASTPPVTIAVDNKQLAALGLTPREREVMQWVSEGKRDREIAIILGLSPRTVEKHVCHIFEKLGVETRTAAASECRYSIALSKRAGPLTTRHTLRAARDGLPSQPIHLPAQRDQRIPQNRKH